MKQLHASALSRFCFWYFVHFFPFPQTCSPYCEKRRENSLALGFGNSLTGVVVSSNKESRPVFFF